MSDRKSRFAREFARCSLRHPNSFLDGNCDLCGSSLPRNKDGTLHKTRRWCSSRCRIKFTKNHVWKWARREARRLGRYKCKTCSSTEKLEVNHIIPLKGRGYSASCYHHQDRLELLCSSCHKEVTKGQRKNDSKK